MSSARPPAGAPQLSSSNYAILGARGDTRLQPWKLSGNLSAGRALEDAGGRWFWLQADAQQSLGRVSAFWLDYRETFHFGSIGAQVQPEIRFAADALALRPMATLARWDADSISATYGVLGGALQWNRNVGSYVLRLTGDAYTAGDNGFASGGYYSLTADAYRSFRGTTVGAAVTQAHNPVRNETGYSLWASRPLGEKWRLDAQVTHTVTDPIFGTPGALGLTASASWRFSHRVPPPPPQLASVGAAVGKGRVVQFSVRVPNARSVAVSGTFSDWRPIALRRKGDVWSGSVNIEPGTHQFGFLVNGSNWFVPPDATEIIDDGFGRKNITLVVRPK